MPAADFWEILIRLLLSMLGGAVLGSEREVHNKPAGLRTHMMVSLGSAIFIVVSLESMRLVLAQGQSIDSPVDPLRVIQGVIGGVGFLGAGAIIRSGGAVHGLTTAASIWMAAAIGVASGLGFYAIAAASAVLGLIILLLVGFTERVFFQILKDGGAPRADESKADSEIDSSASGPRPVSPDEKNSDGS